MKKIIFVVFSLASALKSFCQPNFPDPGPVYTTTEIPRVHINLDVDSLEELYLEENWYSNHEYPVQFVFESSTQQDTLQDVGFRFRGNTSRDKIKKSFKFSKIERNTFRFCGLDIKVTESGIVLSQNLNIKY